MEKKSKNVKVNNIKEKRVKESNVKKKKAFDDKILIVLVILLIIITITLIIMWISNINSVDTDSDEIKELHNYFSVEDLTSCDGLFNYASDKIEYDDVASETRLCIAYQKANIEETEKETYKPDKKKETCTVDNMIFRKDDETDECNIIEIKRDVIDSSYKKIFGKDIENNESFKVDNLNICYLKDDYYYCGLSEVFTYTLGSESTIYRVIDTAKEKGSELVIYDYFVKINGDDCYENYTTSIINRGCTKHYKSDKKMNFRFMKNYGTKYKHVYKKTEDNTYYWVSSEPY